MQVFFDVVMSTFDRARRLDHRDFMSEFSQIHHKKLRFPIVSAGQSAIGPLGKKWWLQACRQQSLDVVNVGSL